MELVPKESISLEDGKHAGKVSKIEYREEPYKYTDVFVKPDGFDFELKYGCPTNDGIGGKLMKLLAKFTKIEAGKMVDPEKVLLAQDVSFMSMQEEKGDKTFVRIVEGSLKPLVSKEVVKD